MDIMKMINDEQLRGDLPNFRVGDTVEVHYRVIEGERERIQIFTGTVIKIQGSGPSKTFTVRRISYGVGVERTFPMHSPRIGKLVLVRSGKTRRAKLYYLRERQGRAARVKEKRRVILAKEEAKEEKIEEPVVATEEVESTEE